MFQFRWNPHGLCMLFCLTKADEGFRGKLRCMRKYLFFRDLFFAYLVVLIGISVIPIGNSGYLSSVTVVDLLRLDYLLHALVFIPLASLWRLGFPDHSWWLVITGGIDLASCCEWIQFWLPYRGYNINDLAGNIAGVMLGFIVAMLLRYRNS